MKRMITIGLFLSLAACATPNLSGYADQSVKLAALTRTELVETAIAYKDAGREPEAKQVAASNKVVNATLTAMIGYSAALRSLSESGESGSEAANTAFSHIDTLSKTLGSMGNFATLGLSEAAANLVSEAAQKISDFVHAQQANAALREVTIAAQPAVNGMRDILVAVFSYCADQGLPPCDQKKNGSPRSSGTAANPEGSWAKAITAATDHRIQDLQNEIGDNIIGTASYLRATRDELYRRYLQELRESEAAPTSFCVGDNDCIDPSTIATIERLDARRVALAPELEEYNSKRKAAMDWQAQRLKDGAKIVNAAVAWAKEHKDVVSALQECQFAVLSCRSVDASELASILLSTIKSED